jgi:glutamate/aspartate transport system permease protein
VSGLDFSVYDAALLRGFVWSGLVFSVQLTLVAMAGGLVLGTLLALMRLSGPKPLQWLARLYVDGLRAVPLVMVILWVYLLIPLFIGPIGKAGAAFVTFTLFEAAFYAEIVRAGIQAIPRGQLHAGQALGLSYGQNMRHVVLPQALRHMLPVLLTQTIVLFQDTSLVYAIGAYDLLHGFETAGKNYGRPVEAYLAAALAYFAICFALSQGVKRLQRRVAFVH